MPSATRWMALAAVFGSLVTAAQTQTADEYQVKAAYMYNFSKFVEWPAQVFDSPTQPIVFCVLGQTPLSPPLRGMLSGKVVERRPLVFRQLSDSTLAGKCQVLFLGSPDKNQNKEQMLQTLDQIKSLPVLTVGDTEDFTKQGGIVRFVPDSGRVLLEVNLDAADAAKLSISSKLLSISRILRKSSK